MLAKLRSKQNLCPHFTDNLLENGYGVVIESTMPISSYLAIDIDHFYHHIGLQQVPEIADILLASQRLSASDEFHIYIIEMKNICSPKNFTVSNIYNKFHTAIEDFMKNKYSDVFMDANINITKFRLLFITDAYKLKQKGLSENQIRSFLSETKIAALQAMPLFCYRDFKVHVEYELPNPLLSWS